ncbi:MAG TPA: HAD-IIB family hydrolase [Candidatus Paceibacterota bacterium]
MENGEDLKNIKVVAFDLDGTLTESKSNLTPEMANLMRQLLGKYEVIVASGGAMHQFEKQFLKSLNASEIELEHLTLIPESGGRMYEYRNGQWIKIISHELSQADKDKILPAIKQALNEVGWKLPEKHWGNAIEDRGTEFTISALGQEAPVAEKLAWDPDRSKRTDLAQKIQAILPDYNVRVGGITSVDVTKKGVSKAVALTKYMKDRSITTNEMVYIGDALFPGGNDSSVLTIGIHTQSVTGPEETKQLISTLLK